MGKRTKLTGVFDQATNARRVARNQAQKPGATRKIEDKRRKPPKHHRQAEEVQYEVAYRPSIDYGGH
jgi:hypothetical protein